MDIQTKKHIKNILTFVNGTIIRYTLLVLLVYIFYRIINVANIVDLIKVVFKNLIGANIIKCASLIIGIVDHFLLYVILILGTYTLYNKISYLEEIVAYRRLIILCLSCIAIWYYYETNNIKNLFCFEIIGFGLFILIDTIEYRFLGEPVPEEKKESNYNDSPIYGREYLMRNQKSALEKIEKALHQSNITDSFNIALISKWGTGKTSVIDTLIHENHDYIYLKISSQTLASTNDIITYVNSFLRQTFVKYGVSLFDNSYLDNFFSIILSNSETFSNIKLLDKIINKSGEKFGNIEFQRILLGKKVQRLLEKSGKKKIVIIIDDVDRSKIKEEILKLIIQFSSIQGIVSIVLLNDFDDYTYSDRKKDDADSKEMIIDKYIHLRIFMEETKAEKEDVIKRHVRIANDNYVVSKDCWIWGKSDMNEIEIGKMVERHSTVYLKDGIFPVEDKYNILTELFIYNYLNCTQDFGTYFEDLYMTYFFTTKEGNSIFKYIIQHKDNKDPIYNELVNRWIGDGYSNEIARCTLYKENAIRIHRWLMAMKSFLSLAFNTNKEYGKSLFDLMCKAANRANFSITTISNPNDNKNIIVGAEDFKLMLFGDGKFDELVQKEDYAAFVKELDENISRWYNFLIFSYIIEDFVLHIRKIVNNVRYFKMQLREIELSGQNYVDYLIDDYQKNANYEEFIAEIKNGQEKVKVTIPLLRDCVNQILFSNYILFGGENTKYLSKKYNIYLHRGKNILILIRNMEEKTIVYLDSNGKYIDDISKVLSEEEIKEIKRKYG